MPCCDGCPAGKADVVAQPASVECSGNVLTWRFVSPDAPVHLAALFRDPGIQDTRSVSTVLDLCPTENGHVRAGRQCWLGPMLRSLDDLPRGLRLALDNGVRCPCPTRTCRYSERVTHCLNATRSWLQSLRHPDGGSPALLVCDRDLARSFAFLGLLVREDGSTWEAPRPFVNAIGERVRCFDRPALICPHPMVVSRHPRYRDRMKAVGLASAIAVLARM